MNSSEFIIPQDQIKNNIVTSGFFGKSWGWHDVFGKFWDRQQFLQPQGGIIFSYFRVWHCIFFFPDPTMACFLTLCKLLFLRPESRAWKSCSQTRVFFFFGSGTAFSSSQTRPWLTFRRYVNSFFSYSGLECENHALRPGFSSFSGLALHFLLPRPDHSLLFGVM